MVSPNRRCFVNNRGGNTQINFGARSRFTPHFQFPANPLGTLAHTRQAPMPYPFRTISHVGINSFSVISYSQAKQIIAVSDFGFDSARMRMVESIPQPLTSNPEDLNVNVWMQRLSGSFNNYPELYRILITILRNKFFSQGCDFLC